MLSEPHSAQGDSFKELGGDANGSEKWDEKVKMCWNVSSWARGGVSDEVHFVEECDIRAKVINFYKPDVVCLVETRLKGDEVARFGGNDWFGNIITQESSQRLWWGGYSSKEFYVAKLANTRC